MICSDAVGGALDIGRKAEQQRHFAVAGLRSRIRTVTSVTTPSSPSEPVDQAEQVIVRPASRCVPPEPHDLARRSSPVSTPSRLLVVRPYLRQCTPPEFSATLPPIVQAIWLELGSGA
jgi:hypothetical protein